MLIAIPIPNNNDVINCTVNGCLFCRDGICKLIKDIKEEICIRIDHSTLETRNFSLYTKDKPPTMKDIFLNITIYVYFFLISNNLSINYLWKSKILKLIL